VPVNAGESKFWAAVVVMVATLIPAARAVGQVGPVRDVRGCDVTVAEGVLTQERFAYDFEQEPQSPVDVVVAQEPWDTGDGATLTFFPPEEGTPRCAWTLVPSVTGQSAKDAAAALRFAQLSPYFDESQEGIAISQRPEGSTFVARDTAVAVEFAPPAVPDPGTTTTAEPPRPGETTTTARPTAPDETTTAAGSSETSTTTTTAATNDRARPGGWWAVPWARPQRPNGPGPRPAAASTEPSFVPAVARGAGPSPLRMFLSVVAIVSVALFTGLLYEFVNRQSRRHRLRASSHVRARVARRSGVTLPSPGHPSFAVIARLQTRGTARFLEG
jgi:hypothetical protein